jgi:prepilin-type N-terminal cleavage/methylation domain-containing protein
MLKRSSPHGFTLVEMLTVMLIIAVIAGLVMGTAGSVTKKAAKEKANTEIKAMQTALEAYRAENGTFPRNDDTDDLDPKQHGSATGNKYKKTTEFLYAELANDRDLDGKPDSKPYMEFSPSQLSGDKTDGKLTRVKYIQDPFGNSYGYSTAAAKAEEKYQSKLRNNPSEERPSDSPGYNPNYDLWSTAGAVIAEGAPTEADRQKWVKNW